METTRTRGLIPLDWMHKDFGPVLAVLDQLDVSDELLWDTDDPEPARDALRRAEAMVYQIDSESIRESWHASIADRYDTITVLFS
jgi:hypothetical protein